MIGFCGKNTSNFYGKRGNDLLKIAQALVCCIEVLVNRLTYIIPVSFY